MKRHLLFLTLVAATICLPCTLLNAQRTDTLRIAFYNTENFFDTRHDSLKDDSEFLPESIRHWDNYRYWRKQRKVSKTIMAIGEGKIPALVGLCEVENDSVLTDLTQRSPLQTLNYRYVMTNSPDKRGIDVALIYQRDQFKLLRTRSLPVLIDHPTRDILLVSGQLISGDTLDVFVVHLPSRVGGEEESEPSRLTAARVIRMASDSIMDIRKNAHIVIMGDFNDYPHNRSIEEILGAYAPDKKVEPRKLYHLLVNKVDEGEGSYGSYKYNGKWDLLDHLIVSGTLLNTSAPVYTSEKLAKVAQFPFLMEDDERYGGKKPLRTFGGMKYLDGYSDHLPVYFDIIVKTE